VSGIRIFSRRCDSWQSSSCRTAPAPERLRSRISWSGKTQLPEMVRVFIDIPGFDPGTASEPVRSKPVRCEGVRLSSPSRAVAHSRQCPIDGALNRVLLLIVPAGLEATAFVRYGAAACALEIASALGSVDPERFA
jgi:hypothetical protein